MFNFDSTIYKCSLLYLEPDEIVKVYKTKEAKIEDVDRYIAMRTILVKQTLNKKNFREIITKKFIPAYRTIYVKSIIFGPDEGELYYQLPKIPCFVRCHEERLYGNPPRLYDIEVATEEDIEKYIKYHTSSDGKHDKFLEELNDIFIEAEERYDEALSENNTSHTTGEKSFIKSIKKKN